MLAICRSCFFAVILFCVVFLGQHVNNINISTDLHDLSPSLSQQALTQEAIDTLSRDIESRFLLVLTSKSKAQLSKANKILDEKISQLNTLTAGQLSSEALLAQLQTYRFQLLSQQQQQQLQEKNTEALTQEALRQLYRMDNSVQLLPPTQDPLGTFSQFIDELIGQNFSNNQDSQSTEGKQGTLYFSSRSIRIKPEAMNIDEQKQLLNEFKILESTLQQQQVNLLRSGVFFFAADAAEKSERDIKLISSFSTAGIILLLLLVFRSLITLVLPLLSIAIGIVFAVGVSHYLYNSIHILTIVFGASLLGIIIDYSLHYFYHQQIKHTDNEKQNRDKLFRALLLSVLTSLVGYSALSFSSLEALKKVAIFSCCGIFAAWLSVITIGSLSRIKSLGTHDLFFTLLLQKLNQLLDKISSRSSFALWVLALVLASVAVSFIGLPTNDNPRFFFEASDNLLKEEQQATEFSQGFEPGRYLLIQGSNSEEVYQQYQQLNHLLDQQSESKNQLSPLFSALDILPSPSQQRENYKLQAKLYQAGGVAEQLFGQLGLPPQQAQTLYKDYQQANDRILNPEQVFNTDIGLPPIWLTKDQQNLAFVLLRKDSDVDAIKQLIDKHSLELNKISYINSLALAEQALKDQRQSASLLLLLAYLFIACLMLIYYRKLNALWVLLVPLSATLGSLILLSLFAINITLFHVMALFLVLGLGMDYVIFIREMQAHEKLTQNAILLSTLTTLLSFGLLSLSSIPVAQAFGMTLLLGNSLNFLAALYYAQIQNTFIQETNYAR